MSRDDTTHALGAAHRRNPVLFQLASALRVRRIDDLEAG